MIDIFGENTGYYFYSSVFQGNMALLALIGVFAVYKLQQVSYSLDINTSRLFGCIDNQIIRFLPNNTGSLHDNIKENLYKDMGKLLKVIKNPEQYVTQDDKDNLKKIKEFVNRDENKILIYLYESQTKEYNSIIKMMKKPFCWILGVIILSLILLPLANLLHRTHVYYEGIPFEGIPILMLIVFNIIALSLIASYIIGVLKLK